MTMAEPLENTLKGSVRLGNYLRRLRVGYGYSLRRVEERARAEGGEIDNSQLSRYEKGVCYPSFDKLRVLASVFNVSVQAFSDVVDLEAFEERCPEAEDPAELTAAGESAARAGDYGLAFACFEKAVEQLESGNTAPGADLGQARVNLAHVLARLGKLALAEQELKQALRVADRLAPAVAARALLALAGLHADQGDLFLAEIEAERAERLSRESGDQAASAMAVHTIARVLADRGRHAEAIERYRNAGEIYAALGNGHEAARVRVNIGARFVALGKVREGVRLLRASLQEVQAAGYRRLEAQACSNLGEAYYRLNDAAQATACFRRSDAIAGGGTERYPDLLFFNAFYEWKLAVDQKSPTREKIAFGRLKVLRSSLERRFPEVDAFDALVERGRSRA
jgi:tetratricopeptide (TPR) repeat protein